MAAELAIIAKLQDEASSGIRALRGEIEGLGESGGVAAKGFATLQSVGLAAITAIGAAAVAAGVALAGFVAGSISKAADLEAQMDTVAALLGATAQQAELLRQATLDLALDPQLKVSATEAAQAIEMLAQNGLTVEEILGGAARATVLLANATGADFTIAARIATDAMALWGMEASDLEQVANGVTAVLVQSKFEVNDYALALAQAGGVAAAVGVSFSDFNATLVAIAPYFASGSDAGTSFKTMLQRLIPTTSNAKDAMAALGLITENGANAFFDSQGNMRDMAEVAGILHGALSGLSEQQRLQALSTIFGTDAMRAAAAMSQFTEDQFRNLMAVMANTSAAEIAAQRMENFSGAMDILKGVVEGLQLMLGNVLLPILTKLALAGANLLAAWGPPVIATFERLIGIFSEFFGNIQSGMSVWGALRSALLDIGKAFGMTADGAVAFSAGVANAIEAIVTFIAPIAQAITSFISWKDVLVALGIAIASVVVPALIAIIQFAAPIVAVFAVLVLAIAAVRNAFETNFLGIRDLALTLWGALQGVFEGIRALLSGDTTTAMAAFRSAWETGWAAVVGFVQNAGSQIGQALSGLWQGIVAWFQGIDWGALGQTLIEKFFSGMAALGQAAAGRWEWLLTSITSFIQSVDWGKLGYTLVDLLGKGLLGAVGLIGTALAGIVTFIWNFITGTNWIELGTNLVNAILDGFSAFASGVGEKLGEWKTAIFDWAGAEDWSGVAEKISTMVGDKLGEMKEAISSKLSEWQMAIFDWAGAEDWQGVADHIAEGVGEKLGEAKDAVTAQLSEWQTAIFDWAGTEDWQGVADHIAEGVGEKLGEAKDAITAKLTEWQTAIFDWAGTEDWSGVAEKIAEMVGTALGNAGSSIISTLDSWEQEIFGWAGTEDWGGVAETIAENVGTELSTMHDKVTEKLSGWLQAFKDWVNTVDWYQVGYDLMWKITDAFLDFKTAITGKLTSWVTDLKTETEGYAWYEVAAGILLKIVTAAAGTVADWATAVGAWIKNIGSAITNAIGNLNQIGRDIVAGIAAGISGGWDLIQGALAALGDRTAQETPPAFEQNSPSKFAIPVGMGIDEGVALGITQGAGLIMNAIHAVADATRVESAKAFGEAMAAVAEGIAAALSAALDVGSFSGVGDGFGAALQQIAAMMAQMVNAIAEANTYSKEVLEELVEFVGLAGDINDLLVQTADVTDYIARWRPPSVSATNAAILMLVGYLGVMVNGIVGLNMEAMLILGALGEFLESALKLPELFVGIADVMSFLASWQAPSLAPAIASMNTLATFLRQLVAAVAGANTMGLGMLAILAAFIETVSGIVELIAPLTDAIKNVVAFPGGDDLYIFTRNMEAIATYLAALVAAVASANEWGALSLELLEAFVGVVGEIADLITPMLEAIKNVVSFPGGGDLYLFVRNIQSISVYLSALVNAVAESNQWGSLSLALLDEFVQVAGGIAELITPMTEAIKNIVAFQLPDWTSFLFGVATIGTYMAYLVGSFSEGLLYSHDALELLGEYVDVVGALAEGMADFVGAIGLVASFVAPDWTTFLMNVGTIGTYMAYLVGSFSEGLRYSQGALELLGPYIEVVGALAEGMESFVEAIGLVASFVAPDWTSFLFNVATIGAYMAMLVSAFSEGLSYSQSALELLGEYVSVVGDLVDLVGDAIEALAALAGYVSGVGLYPAMLAFATDLTNVVLTLVMLFDHAGILANEAVAAAGELAGSVEDLLGMVTEGVEALTLLSTYVSSSGLYMATLSFATDLTNVILTLVMLFDHAGILTSSAVTAAGELADGVNDLMGMVAEGVEALSALAGYVSAAGLYMAMLSFATDLTNVILTLVMTFDHAGILTNSAVAAAGELADGIGDLIGMVADGIEGLAALGSYVPIANAQAAVQQFAADLVTVVLALVDALQQAGILANAAVTEAGEMAGALGDLVDVIAPAVEAVVFLVGYTTVGGLRTNVEQFAADLVIVIQTLVDGLSKAGMLANAAVAEAGEMAKSIEAILKVMEPALDPDKGALPLLAKYTSAAGLAQKTQQFTTDLILVTQILVDGLTQSALAAGVALAKAGEMSKALKDLFDAIDPALGVIEELGEYASNANLAASAQRFTNDLVTVTTILVTGLTAAAAQLGGAAIAAARQFADDTAAIAGSMFTALSTLQTLADTKNNPSIEPTLAYIVQSSGQITSAFAAAGDIGAAVQYAAAFRANLEQLVSEVQAAVAQLNALAGSGTGGSVQSALTAIAASLQNTEGQFAGAGSALAGALIDALKGGIDAGQNTVVGAAVEVLRAVEATGQSEAREFSDVGAAITDAMADGVSSGQSQVIAAVVQVVSAAIAAGLNEAKKAGAIGEEVIRALLTEMNSSRSTLDQAGSSAGTALIDGMVRAIVAGKSRLVSAIRDAVAGAVAAAKAALGIASPSKVAFELMDNFMRTAATRLGNTNEMADAVGRSIDAAMATAAARLSGVKLATPVAVNAGLSRSPVVPGVLPRPATAGAAPDGSFRGGSINIYGNIVLPNVSNPVSFLEELDALRGGGR